MPDSDRKGRIVLSTHHTNDRFFFYHRLKSRISLSGVQDIRQYLVLQNAAQIYVAILKNQCDTPQPVSTALATERATGRLASARIVEHILYF